MIRYCPECGHLGPVRETARDCCPDGSHAAMVPGAIARQARLGLYVFMAKREAWQAEHISGIWMLAEGRDLKLSYTGRMRKLVALPEQSRFKGELGKHVWEGAGPEPRKWFAPDGTLVYRSYGDYCDD